MNRYVLSLFNRPIALQVAAILVACLIAGQLLAVIVVTWRYSEWEVIRVTPPGLVAGAFVDRMLSRAEPSERARIAQLAGSATSQFLILGPQEVRDLGFPEAEKDGMLARVAARLRPGLEDQLTFVEGRTPGAVAALGGRTGAVRTTDGLFVAFDESPILDHAPPFLLILIIGLSMTLPVAAISIWAVRVLTEPLRRLAAAADSFAVDLVPTPVEERGPPEIRKLAGTFNAMCGRIRDLVEHRSRMLAAVGHDLRTPLTRIRLRAEGLEAGEDRERLLRDTSSMNRMIDQALGYLRDEAAPIAHERLDLGSLVESICDDFADSGAHVSFEQSDGTVVVGQSDMLTRAFSNLIDNAAKFGTRSTVVLSRHGGEACVLIEDDGPGIEAESRTRVFEAFGRGDPSRTGETAGFGLGLTIARQIIERHGGSIELGDAALGGLRVTVRLPLAPIAGDITRSPV
jgi:signal transduction histidine kinase